jgi:hypothetical protein
MSIFCASDVKTVREDRLMVAAASHPELARLSDASILRKLKIAEKEVARKLKVRLEPTVIFPYEPSEAEIAALDGKLWDEEPGYDYDAGFFWADSWGFLVLNERPTISVDWVRFGYPSPQNTFYDIPKAWLRLDKKAGQVRLVPVGQTFTAPLNAFMMQVMGGGRSVPYMLQVKYTAGLKDVKEEWPDLVDVIMKSAVLSLIKDAFKPQSGSISADGLSQSLSVDVGKYGETIEEALFGPKGSNGGFWTAIHGLPNTVGGAGV